MQKPVKRPKNIIKISLVRGNNSWTRKHTIAKKMLYNYSLVKQD